MIPERQINSRDIWRVLVASVFGALLVGLVCLPGLLAQVPMTGSGVGAPGGGALAMSYTPVTTGSITVAYTGATPSTSGGTAPYTYSIHAGTLPTGLSLNTSTGVITGTPTVVQTQTGIVLRVTDNVSATIDSSSFQIAVAYRGPGDIVASASAWWGLRSYSAAYATGSNPAADVCDSATFTTCSTINILATGAFDTATASGSAACATACVIKKLYDQTGNARDLTCASAAACPVLTFSCLGSFPCFKTTTAAQTGLIGASFSPVATKMSFSFVANRAAGTAIVIPLRDNGAAGNRIRFDTAAATLTLAGSGGGTVTATGATTNAWHAYNAVGNGASSFVDLNGTQTTGTATIGAGAGTPAANVGAASTTLSQMEGGFWDNLTFTSGGGGQATAICHNQFSYWGTSTSC